MILAGVKSFVRRNFPFVYDVMTRRYWKRLRMQVLPILLNPHESEPLNESNFVDLQSQFGIHPEYGYDPVSTWSRGTHRCQQLISLGQLHMPGSRVLEVACGDGMSSFLLHGYGHHAHLVDMEDWRDERAKNLPFTICDVCAGLPFESNCYDLAFSYNAFEHFADPESALREIVRVCKPGGYLYFEFGPLYSSPWGLHAYRMLRMPYPQFLFSTPFIDAKLRELGIRDLGKERTELQYTNAWRYERFRQLWRTSGCEIIKEVEYRDSSHLYMVLRYPQCFRGRGLTLDDLTVQTLCITLRKPA